MRKLWILLAGLFVFVLTQAQVYNSIAVDTVKGAETITIAIPGSFPSDGALKIEALCTEIGGTSDGTIVVQGSVTGTNYVTLSTEQSFLECNNDTLTIIDGAVGLWSLSKTPYNKYRLSIAGTTGDTTAINVYWDK